MDRINGSRVVSATDVVAFLACSQVTWLDRRASDGVIDRPERDDPMLDLLRGRGMDHERSYLQSLRNAGVEIEDIADGGEGGNAAMSPQQRLEHLQDRRDATVRAMRAGTPVVYQATFFDDAETVWWRGHADFLSRVARPSELGEWSYEPEDTKLSRHIAASAVLQLCFYADMIEATQGSPVEHIHVVLGHNEKVSVRVREVDAYFRQVRRRFESALIADEETYPLPVGHCGVCRWTQRCRDRWEADDHLTRVAFLTVEQSRRLETAGIPTLTALADTPDGLTVTGIGQPTFVRLQQQARLQRRAVPGQPPPYELVEPIEEDLGLAALPEPDPGDVFYDIEGHPYAAVGGLEYLHGIGWIENGSFAFDGWWAHDEPEERAAFERLIDYILERRARHPGMHVYHYAPYETTAIGRMMGKYGTREDAVDDLLRNNVFVDLYRVVRQGVRVGVRSYSIKKLEPLYMAPRGDEIGDGGSSIIEYERWLQSHDQRILDAILAYNRDDVESNYLLREWLEARRAELVDRGIPITRPRVRADEGDHIDPDLAALIERLNEGRFVETASS